MVQRVHRYGFAALAAVAVIGSTAASAATPAPPVLVGGRAIVTTDVFGRRLPPAVVATFKRLDADAATGDRADILALYAATLKAPLTQQARTARLHAATVALNHPGALLALRKDLRVHGWGEDGYNSRPDPYFGEQPARERAVDAADAAYLGYTKTEIARARSRQQALPPHLFISVAVDGPATTSAPVGSLAVLKRS